MKKCLPDQLKLSFQPYRTQLQNVFGVYATAIFLSQVLIFFFTVFSNIFTKKRLLFHKSINFMVIISLPP